jgi:hypothetical protein
MLNVSLSRVDFSCCSKILPVLHLRIVPVLHLRKYVASLYMYSLHCTFQVFYVPVTFSMLQSLFSMLLHCFKTKYFMWHQDGDLRGNFDFNPGT